MIKRPCKGNIFFLIILKNYHNFQLSTFNFNFQLSTFLSTFAPDFRKLMSKYNFFAIISAVILLCGCAKEFNAVYKSDDYVYRYEYAKQLYAEGKFSKASIFFGDMVTLFKGTDNAEECLFLYGMSCYNSGDYESASEIFKKYYSSYSKGKYAEIANYFVGQSLYQTIPEPRLDQTPTVQAMKAYQDFIDLFPYSQYKNDAQTKLYQLQGLRRSFSMPSSITTLAPISATAPVVATTTRLASSPRRMHSKNTLTPPCARSLPLSS